MLSLNLVNEVLKVLQPVLKDIRQGCVSEGYRNSPTHIEVLELVHVRHLDNQLMNGRERQERESLTSHGLQIEELLDDLLDLGVVEPKHFADLCKKYHDHLSHLLIQTRLFLDEKIDQEVLEAHSFLIWYFTQVFYEELLKSG